MILRPHAPSAALEASAIHRAARSLCVDLQAAGHQATFVGGVVRDMLLAPDRIPADIDISTSAAPEVVARLFPGSGFVGKSFGVSLVRVEGLPFEVATYRREGVYTDRRHPDSVGKGTQEEDSRRRDFTINALYFDPVAGTLADFHGGLDDMRAGTLACVGYPRDRLFEDPLRILRMFRFAVATGFQIAPATLAAAQEPDVATGMRLLSRERILMEIGKVKPGKAGAFFSRFLEAFSPELLDAALPLSRCSVEALEALGSEAIWTRQPTLHTRFPATALCVFLRAAGGGQEDALFRALETWPLQVSDRELLRVVLWLSRQGAEVGTGQGAANTAPADSSVTPSVAFARAAHGFHRALRTLREVTPREITALVALPGAVAQNQMATFFAQAEGLFRAESVRSALPFPEFLRWLAGASFPVFPSRAQLADLHATERLPPAHQGILNALWEAFALLGEAVPTDFHAAQRGWKEVWKAAALACASGLKGAPPVPLGR